VGDILDLDIERRGIEKIKPAARQHALPGARCAGRSTACSIAGAASGHGGSTAIEIVGAARGTADLHRRSMWAEHRRCLRLMAKKAAAKFTNFPTKFAALTYVKVLREASLISVG
jgi:hypothetical protein